MTTPEQPLKKRRNTNEPKTFDADQLIKIAGLPAVTALFQKEPGRVVRLFYAERLAPQVGTLCSAMAKARRPYRMVPEDELGRIAASTMHGGVVAIALPRAILTLDPQEALSWAKTRKPLFILDGVGNPHNLGAIVRTLAFFGIDRLIISDDPAQASPSSAAYRVAEGGLEYVRIYSATDLPGTLRTLGRMYRTIATVAGRGAHSLAELPEDTRPPVIVLGNEVDGLPAATVANCHAKVTLPGSKWVQSLNVSVSAGIFIHHFVSALNQPRQNANSAPERKPIHRKPAPRGEGSKPPKRLAK